MYYVHSTIVPRTMYITLYRGLDYSCTRKVYTCRRTCFSVPAEYVVRLSTS